MWILKLTIVMLAATFTAIPDNGHVGQTAATVDYDTFMQQDVEGRIRTFNQITPENRAELVQTQIKRWVSQHRDRLTAEQAAMMDENLAFVTADRYRQPMNDEDRAKAKELEARTVALFSRDDIRQAMTINATYIPKQP
jgi:hypothetical protein